MSPSGPVKLGEGDFFGEIALIEAGARRTATVTAVRPSELLVLDVQGFHRLMGRSPQLAEAVRDVANQRLQALGEIRATRAQPDDLAMGQFVAFPSPFTQLELLSCCPHYGESGLVL